MVLAVADLRTELLLLADQFTFTGLGMPSVTTS